MQVRQRWLGWVGAGMCLLLVGRLAAADVFCASTSEQFRAALSVAAQNGRDDELRIEQGFYFGRFAVRTTEPRQLWIRGGFEPGCEQRVQDPSLTVLDGEQRGTVLELNAEGAAATLILEAVTLQQGRRRGSTTGGGGLNARVGRDGTLSLIDNRFIANTSTAAGGGVFAAAFAAKVNITGNLFEENIAFDASDGGGLALLANQGQVTLANNRMMRNLAENGAGVWLTAYSGAARLVNNLAVGNRAEGGDGGGMSIAGGELDIVNNTLVKNEAREAGGLQIYLSFDESASAARLYNNLFWDNLSTLRIGSDLWISNDSDGDFIPAPVTLSHNNFNRADVYSDLEISDRVENDNAVEPRFINAEDDDYRLQPASPMINGGDRLTPDLPITDLQGNRRVQGGIVDVGAFEHYSRQGTCLTGDFSATEDRVLSIYIAYYGRPADLLGYQYWAQRLEQSAGDLGALMQAFGDSTEFSRRFGPLDNAALVDNIYQQVLGRRADQAGFQYYLGQLNAGAMTLQSIALNVLDGVQGGDKAVIANRLLAARHSVLRQQASSRFEATPSDVALAEVMARVGSDPEQAYAACVTLDQLWSEVSD